MIRFLIPLILLATSACHETPAPAAPTQTAAAPAQSQHDAAVERMVGVWLGTAVDSPMGDFPVAFAFDRDPAGDIHARLDDGKGMYLDFRFHRAGGVWQLIEEGSIPGVGVQRHTLVPDPKTADAARWVDQADPALLSITIGTIGGAGDRVEWATVLRGEPHVGFALERKVGPEADQIRAALARR